MSRRSKRWIGAILGSGILALAACGGTATDVKDREATGGDGPVLVRTMNQVTTQNDKGQEITTAQLTNEFTANVWQVVDVLIYNKAVKAPIFIDACNPSVVQPSTTPWEEIIMGPDVEITWPADEVTYAPLRECAVDEPAIVIQAGQRLNSTIDDRLIRHGISSWEPGLYRVVVKYKTGCQPGQSYAECPAESCSTKNGRRVCTSTEETTHATFWMRSADLGAGSGEG